MEQAGAQAARHSIALHCGSLARRLHRESRITSGLLVHEVVGSSQLSRIPVSAMLVSPVFERAVSEDVATRCRHVETHRI